jgi:hypothetical protein
MTRKFFQSTYALRLSGCISPIRREVEMGNGAADKAAV